MTEPSSSPDSSKATGRVDDAVDAWLRDEPRVGASVPELDRMFERVERSIHVGDRRIGASLREAPTNVRRSLALGTALAVAAFVAVTARRLDLPVYPPMRFASELVVYAGLLVACILLALRPTFLPSAPTRATALSVVASLGTCIALACLPPAHEWPSELLHFMGGGRWSSPCLYLGLLFGLPLYFVTRLVTRETPYASVLAATAAGLLGNLALHVHCPSTLVEHRLFAHASVVLVFLGCLFLAYALERILRIGT